ncbi:MAG: helix-turn-helix domain-containing protein [Pseudomonadota bacterium]
MTERDEQILEAAMQLFLRYGVKRTSMNDIASEAGVARQTLYNAFSNKDDVLCSLIRLFTDRAMDEIEVIIARSTKLSDRLDIVLERVAVYPFEMLSKSPNAEDLVLGMNAASKEEIDASNERFRAVLADILIVYEASLKRVGRTPRQFADFIHIAASAAKTQAANRKQLDELLQTIRSTVLSYAQIDT